MTPATPATTVPAWNAWTMNPYWSIAATSSNGLGPSGGAVSVIFSRRPASAGMGVHDLRLHADDEHPAAAVADDLDGRRVDAAQGLAGDDLRRRPDCHPALGDVHHQVEQRQQRVDVVGDHQDGQT